MSYTPTKYRPGYVTYVLGCSTPTNLDHGASQKLRSSKREWLGFRPIDLNGNLGELIIVARGQTTHVHIHPAELFRRILITRAAGVLLVHNHPQGNLNPSNNDIDLTERVSEMCKKIGLKLVGHFIVTEASANLFWHMNQELMNVNSFQVASPLK